MMKRVAVLGGTGMAGHVAVICLEEQGHDVYYTSLDAPDTDKSKSLDATDIPVLTKWLDSISPEVVINCIGVLQKHSESRPDIAIILNSYLPRYLEQRYSETAVKVIHLSTDCVFSGTRGGYLEADIPDGETVYDRTKALGEINNGKDLTFRMSIIGPSRDMEGFGLFGWFMSKSGVTRGFTKALWTGVTTVELARGFDAAIKQNLTGLYHLVPNKPIDKYSLLCLFQDIFNKTDVEIEPFDDFVTDKSLVNTRTDFDFEVRDYPQQIKDMYDWIEKHKMLYGHYF